MQFIISGAISFQMIDPDKLGSAVLLIHELLFELPPFSFIVCWVAGGCNMPCDCSSFDIGQGHKRSSHDFL